MNENEIIDKLSDIKLQFREIVDSLRENPELINTKILDLIDDINFLSVEI